MINVGMSVKMICLDVMWDIPNAYTDERLFQGLPGRQNKATTLQYVQRRVKHIEQARSGSAAPAPRC